MKYEIYNRFKAIPTIASFILLSYALLAIADTPAIGYELSIYSATPKIFWVAILFGLANGIILISTGFYRSKRIWIVGMLQILLCNCCVISLYALRGYVSYFGRGDISSYIGMAKDVSNYGDFGSNMYPVISILISQLSQLTNIPILALSKYVAPLFFALYFLGIYCWSKAIIPDRRFVLSSLIAATPILFAWFSISIQHEALCVFTLPFFFYLLQKNSDSRFSAFCIIFFILYPFFHPLIALFCFFYLILFSILGKLHINKMFSRLFLAVSFVVLVGWFIQQANLVDYITTILYQISGLVELPTASNIALGYLDRLGVYTAVRSILSMVSDEIIFSFLSLLVISQIIWRRKHELYGISMCFLCGNLIFITTFFLTRSLVVRTFNLNFNMIFTPLLVGFLLYKFIVDNRRVRAFLIVSMILVSTFIALFSLYPSPLTYRPNNHVTFAEVKGMDWLINYKNIEIKTADILSPVFRYADLIYGVKFRQQRGDLADPNMRIYIQDHFGLENITIVSPTFPIDEDRYLVITEYDVKAFTELWKDMDRFEKEDFIKVDFCNNVDKIYENGEFRSYVVYKDD